MPPYHVVCDVNNSSTGSVHVKQAWQCIDVRITCTLVQGVCAFWEAQGVTRVGKCSPCCDTNAIAPVERQSTILVICHLHRNPRLTILWQNAMYAYLPTDGLL